jgi:PAS domain S-box-containing protein
MHHEEIKRLTGKATAIGMSLTDALADMPEERDKALQLWTRALAGETIDQVTEFGEAGRYRRFYRTRHAPVRDERGEVVGAGEVTSDITDQMQHRQALARTEEELRRAKDELETRVEERTSQLQRSNEWLRVEIEQRVRIEQSLRLEEARLDALLRMSQMGDVPLNEITGFTLEQAIALTRSKIGFVGTMDEDESVYTLHAVSKDVVEECGVTGDPMQWHVLDAGIWADAIREHKTLFVNDYSQPHPSKKGLPQGHPYVEKFMVVPILEGERIVAVAGVGNKASDYDTSDERQVILLLNGMWGCVQRNRSREDLQKAYDDLDEKVRLRTAELSESNAELHKEISERRRAEEELRESEERLKRAQEIARLGSWELDLSRNRLTWSEEVFRIFGVGPQEFGATYEAFLDAVHPEDRGAVDAAYSGSLREGREGFEIEHRIVRRDTGENRNVYTRCEHRRDASGRIERSIGMIHDVTERKKTEALRLALAEQERLRLGAAVEQSSDAVVMVDLDGTIRYVNAAFESINRVPRDQAVGSSYFDIPADGPAAAAIRKAVAAGRSWHGQLSRPIPGGRPVELEVTISPVTDPSGKVLCGLVTEKDITQESALQRQVRQAQKMEALGTLAGGITHDFNNLLGAIVINTELALLDLDPSHPARASLPTVLRAALRGKELVKQIITFSRQREWEKKPLEVSPVVQEAMKLLRSTLPKDVVIHETISPESGMVLGDPSQIHQIVVNLCQNAALAMKDEGGDLEVTLEPVEVDAAMAARHPDLRPGPHVRLTVADTGCGMSRELMERIFEPFFTTRGPGQGSGLGLAVVHGIVRGYGGTIIVYSEPGKGSVFSVYLPRLEGRTPEADAARMSRVVRGRGRILLVEDEEAQRTSLAKSLRRLGYRVTARAEGRSALRVFRKNPDDFDIVITDQTMPRMSGLELAGALTRVRPELPVILCTGFSEKVNGGIAGHEEVRAFIMKPFTLDEISRLIAKALKNEG